VQSEVAILKKSTSSLNHSTNHRVGESRGWQFFFDNRRQEVQYRS
jgi:hypothetical protein